MIPVTGVNALWRRCIFSGLGADRLSTWSESNGEAEASSSTEAATAITKGLRMNDRSGMVAFWESWTAPTAKECPERAACVNSIQIV